MRHEVGSTSCLFFWTAVRHSDHPPLPTIFNGEVWRDGGGGRVWRVHFARLCMPDGGRVSGFILGVACRADPPQRENAGGGCFAAADWTREDGTEGGKPLRQQLERPEH